MSKEADKTLEQVLKDIEKQFGKGAVMKLGEHKTQKVEVISSGSITLDTALGIGELLKYMDLSLVVKLLLHFMLLQKRKRMVVRLHLLMLSMP